MPSLEHIKSVIKKISSIDEIREHVYFFGGSIPYIYFNKESNREHSDIDILVDEEYLDTIRRLAREYNLYETKYDSLNLDLDDDYGIKLWIDEIYTEFEPVSMKDGILTRKTFSPEKRKYGIQKIPYKEKTDLISELNIDGNKAYCESMELIKAAKEEYGRDKDIKDAEFIGTQKIDNEKYERVKELFKSSETVIKDFQEEKRNSVER